MTAHEVCVLYTAIKLHFEPGPYNFFKFHGKVKNITPQNFDLRPDRWYFHKLSKTYPDKDALTFFFASNFFVRGRVWVRDLLGTESDHIYQEKLRIKESLHYLVTADIDTLILGDFPQTVKVVEGQIPSLLNMAQHGEILEETVVVLNAVMGLFPIWEKKISDTILFPAIKTRCVAYEPFLLIDKKKFRAFLRKSLDRANK